MTKTLRSWMRTGDPPDVSAEDEVGGPCEAEGAGEPLAGGAAVVADATTMGGAAAGRLASAAASSMRIEAESEPSAMPSAESADASRPAASGLEASLVLLGWGAAAAGQVAKAMTKMQNH